MGLQTSESVIVPAAPSEVFPLVASLDSYPRWMRLVHESTSELGDGDPAWSVELRARVGPFARSKRLRMERRVHRPDRLVEFERAEHDGKQHARWTLRVELEPVGADATSVTMHLAYDGALWTGGLLDRVLDEEVRRGRAGLVALVSGEPS
jgi:ribosome-associated toxin RatA of RatAB toxin-antitoxin module